VDSFGYDRAEILSRLRYFQPRYSLRDVAQYNNMGFFTAGEVAARASGLSWNELVEQRLYEPLGMTRSGTVVKGLDDPNMASPHAFVDGKIQAVEPSILDTTGAASSGTSTAADMAKFMMMLLNEGTLDGAKVLEPETVQEIFNRSMVSALSFTELPPISDTTGFYYGLGVDSYDYAGEHIIEKAGALAGVRTVFTLLPGKKSGIVILDNLNLAPFPEAVRAFYVNQKLGFDPTTAQKEIFDANVEIKKIIAPPPAPTNPGEFMGTLESLVGTYENDYYGECSIVQNGQDLSVVCGPAKYTATLKHWSNGAFVMRFPGATQADSITTFEIGEDGMALAFTTEGLGRFTRVQAKE
jgi:CubicO group peptidase (beta-lactamase class C family)